MRVSGFWMSIINFNQIVVGTHAVVEVIKMKYCQLWKWKKRNQLKYVIFIIKCDTKGGPGAHEGLQACCHVFNEIFTMIKKTRGKKSSKNRYPFRVQTVLRENTFFFIENCVNKFLIVAVAPLHLFFSFAPLLYNFTSRSLLIYLKSMHDRTDKKVGE